MPDAADAVQDSCGLAGSTWVTLHQMSLVRMMRNRSLLCCSITVAAGTQSGVVMGGTAILSAVNGLTPHMAGAIDIMVVQQPDGTLKCSPFYGENLGNASNASMATCLLSTVLAASAAPSAVSNHKFGNVLATAWQPNKMLYAIEEAAC